MSSANIDSKEVLAVDGGLSYILFRFPQAAGCENHKTKRFKLRDGEKTASASLKNWPDGKYGVTDFGGDGKMKDVFSLVMDLDGVDFPTALQTVAAFYGIAGAKMEKPQATYNKWPAKPDEQEGKTYYQTKELTATEIKSILTESAWQALYKDPKKDKEKEEEMRLANAKALFAYYHLKSVEWKRNTKSGVTHEYASNEKFPIFIYEEGDGENKWGRFYQPKAEKQYRFTYVGEKPRVFIHGQSQAFVKLADMEALATDNYNKLTDEQKKTALKEDVRLKQIINCSGGSDALNVAAMGYQVVWRNSESEEWTATQYWDLRRICDDFYNLPDIDVTGIKQGHKMALQFLDMKTIWLPERMLATRDAQGKPTNKDLRDFLRFPLGEGQHGTHRKHHFDELVETALPYQFWDVEKKYDKNGKIKKRFGRDVLEYIPNNLRMYNFLYRMGYCRLKSDKVKEGFVYVYVENNIVREVEPSEMETFIHNFLKERNSPEDLRNAFFRSTQVNSTSLAKIEFKEMDFKSYGADYQYIFFNNITWKITADGIHEMQPGSTGMYVWEDKVMKLESLVNGKMQQYKAKKYEDLFTVKQQPDGDWTVDIHRQDCMYMNYVIQTCRMYWREELEERLEFYEHYDTPDKRAAYIAKHNLKQEQLDAIEYYSKTPEKQAEYRAKYHVSIAGVLLTKEEKAIQQQHLANRIYVVGYALHRHKVSSRAWAVWAMDNKISDEGESHGGSGKSILTQGVEMLSRVVTLPSRMDKVEGNSFLFENVTKDTDLILMDDAHQHLSLTAFFAPITGTFVINRKNMKQINIPFRDSGKLWFNSNYGDKELDPSTQRRKLHTVYSDYYHKNSNGNYREDRSPRSDLGKELFDDFDELQWNLTFNFFAYCIKTYLSCESEVRAPGENINKRNLMAIMGDNFKQWADVYFSTEANTLDIAVVREEAQESFFRNNQRMSGQAFLKKLKAWCKLYGFNINPPDKSNEHGRIIANINGTSKEMLYIDTSGLSPFAKVTMPGENKSSLLPPVGDDDEFPDVDF